MYVNIDKLSLLIVFETNNVSILKIMKIKIIVHVVTLKIIESLMNVNL
jgi:hypothetical protein